MKWLVSITAAVSVTALCVRAAAGYCAERPEISAKAAAVISADTGETLYALNAGEKLPMASTTKIMTALLCIESGGLYDEFTVDSEAVKVEGSSMGLREGDTVTKYALCCGMLLPSGNDAANAAAVRIAGSLDAFAELMNSRARDMGLSRTYFVTPSGLEGEGHGSSAGDMALLAREALSNDIFRSICSQSSMKVSFGDPPCERQLKNTNKLLGMYDGVYGVKTGFTDEAGRCLVSACERDGKDLICVTLNDRNDWDDHMALYDWCFREAALREVKLPGDITAGIVGAVDGKLRLMPERDSISVTTVSGSDRDFSFAVLAPPFVYAPVRTGEQIGELAVYFRGRETERVPLVAAEDKVYSDGRKKQEKSLIERIKHKIGSIFSHKG
ncbi:D-alanyl-D-alanine carboxypeptidase family protein [uncultured Ruminococcus sp.]|uniref:D-alanyl-D-alanine carboxypeptidase family protein n=1 Tax=uncultured Ruminococcus sp. TaxID=165186 RepID=UPI0026300915|nr:D-alanyl-D-alanine carboxypeptidase family protein [uncultured Ruminococcus sp.]